VLYLGKERNPVSFFICGKRGLLICHISSGSAMSVLRLCFNLSGIVAFHFLLIKRVVLIVL
jgi:hypothetical protein